MSEAQKARNDGPESKSLYAKLVDAGVPSEEIDSHYSDLYVLVTAKSQAIIGAHFSKEGRPMPNTFKSCDESPSRYWYDIPFEYMPFWETVVEESRQAAVI